MKILFFINGIHPGGKERRMLELMKEIKLRQQFEFELVVMNTEINYPEIFDLKIKIHYLIRKTKKDLTVFRKFYKICKEYKPDVIHCWDSMTAVYSIPACKLLNIKLINGMVVDSPTKRNILNKNWLRAKITFPFSDVIIGNSKAGLEAYKSPLKKSFVIYNGYNFNRNKNLKASDTIRTQLNIRTKYMVGMVATFSAFKDYKTYYNAAANLLRTRNDITFLAIGHDTDSLSSNELVDKKYHQFFRLLGAKRDVESFVSAMDVAVLSTFTEGLSNSILEYMALGKPVVATSGGGTAEIIEDGKTGLLVEGSDAGKLADGIEQLLDNPELRRQMGLSGQKRIQKLFSIDTMVNKYVIFYERLTKNKSVNNKKNKSLAQYKLPN